MKKIKRNNQIRVLQFLPTLGMGGIASVVTNYYSKIDKNRIVFDFVTHGGREDYHEELISSGSRIYYVGTIPENGLIKYFFKISRILKENRYEIVHFHVRKIRYIFIPVAKIFGAKKIIVHAHTAKKDNANCFWRVIPKIFGAKRLACGTDAGMAVFGNNNFTILHNAVDMEKFINVEKTLIHEFRKSVGCDNNTILIGSVGALIPIKNQKFIIQVMNSLRKYEQNFKCVIIGKGKLYQELEKEIEVLGLQNVVFLIGERHDIPVCMNALDIFMLTSEFEGIPMAGVEAQAAGCTCLFSTGVPTEVDLGIVNVEFLETTENKIEEWVHRIRLFGRKPSRTETLNNKLRESQYSLRKCVNDVEKLYEYDNG